MSSRYKVIVVISLLLVAVVLSGCGDPRPIKQLPAPTPIGRMVEPTPTLAPALAGAMGAQQSPQAAEVPAVAPASPPDATAGQEIFAQNCVACHGQDGKGVVQGTPDFTSPEYARNAIPAVLFEVITNGKGAMPAWGGVLDEQQRWDVLFYELDFGVTNEMVARGKEVFAQNCAACHGQDGTGVVEGTPDFTDPAFWASRSMAQEFEIVTNGKGAMPAWGAVLSEDDRWAAVSYIRTFGYTSTHQP